MDKKLSSGGQAEMTARTLQIRRAHQSARPTHENPAWLNCHHDMTHLLRHIAQLEAQLKQALGQRPVGMVVPDGDGIAAVLHADTPIGTMLYADGPRSEVDELLFAHPKQPDAGAA